MKNKRNVSFFMLDMFARKTNYIRMEFAANSYEISTKYHAEHPSRLSNLFCQAAKTVTYI